MKKVIIEEQEIIIPNNISEYQELIKSGEYEVVESYDLDLIDIDIETLEEDYKLLSEVCKQNDLDIDMVDDIFNGEYDAEDPQYIEVLKILDELSRDEYSTIKHTICTYCNYCCYKDSEILGDINDKSKQAFISDDNIVYFVDNEIYEMGVFGLKKK